MWFFASRVPLAASHGVTQRESWCGHRYSQDTMDSSAGYCLNGRSGLTIAYLVTGLTLMLCNLVQ